jgi:hypothetical protein
MLNSRNSSIQQVVFKQKQSLSPSEHEFLIQSQRDDCGCSKNCLSNLIQRFNNCSSSNNNNNLTSFNVCHQIGRANSASRQLESGTSLFQSFVVECCRQPFYDVICGTSDQQAASKQLNTFLVANFEQAKVVSLSGGKYVDWIYQLLSISQRLIEVSFDTILRCSCWTTGKLGSKLLSSAIIETRKKTIFTSSNLETLQDFKCLQ